MDKKSTTNIDVDKIIIDKESNEEEIEELMHIPSKIQIGQNHYLCFA